MIIPHPTFLMGPSSNIGECSYHMLSEWEIFEWHGERKLKKKNNNIPNLKAQLLLKTWYPGTRDGQR